MSPRNLTRENIEELNDIEPYCFETDREEQWFNIGLQYGLDVADADPKSPWISVNEKLPPVEKYDMSIMVLAVNTEGKINFSKYDYDAEKWVTPELDIFTHWMFLPKLPK